MRQRLGDYWRASEGEQQACGTAAGLVPVFTCDSRRRPHTCQPSPSRRDSPKADVPPDDPKSRFRRPDLSRSMPKTRFFKPDFCLFSLLFSRNSSFFCVFWPFFMYPSVADSYPNKISACIRALFWLKSSFSCHFPWNARNFVYISGLFFLEVNV